MGVHDNAGWVFMMGQNMQGWKIELDGKELTVKMEDEMFLERLNNMEEPHFFGKRFNVMLEIITKKAYGMESKSYVIKRVHHESKSK